MTRTYVPQSDCSKGRCVRTYVRTPHGLIILNDDTYVRTTNTCHVECMPHDLIVIKDDTYVRTDHNTYRVQCTSHGLIVIKADYYGRTDHGGRG